MNEIRGPEARREKKRASIDTGIQRVFPQLQYRLSQKACPNTKAPLPCTCWLRRDLTALLSSHSHYKPGSSWHGRSDDTGQWRGLSSRGELRDLSSHCARDDTHWHIFWCFNLHAQTLSAWAMILIQKHQPQANFWFPVELMSKYADLYICDFNCYNIWKAWLCLYS